MSGAVLKEQIEVTYYKWMESISTANFSAGIGYFIDGKIDNLNREIPFHIVNMEDDHSQHKLCSKLYAALRYFLENTNAGWMVRICSDTAINERTLPLFLDELNNYYRPYEDVVIQGSCLGKINVTYLQGGSGFVFSRKAASDLFNNFDWFQYMCNQFKSDDRVLGFYLSHIGITPWQATNRWFLGHSFVGRSSAYEAVTNISGANYCKIPVSKKGCRSYFTRVKDITFWHDRVKFKDFIPHIEKIRDATPDNLYFFVPNNKPELCLGTPNTKSQYYDP